MWFGGYDNDTTPGRITVLRDILSAVLILGIASSVVWYIVTQQVFATAPATNDTEADIEITTPQQNTSDTPPKEVVLYIDYPCAECQTLIPSLVTALAQQSSLTQSKHLIYRPVYRDTSASRDAAGALLCAREQGMFETYYAALPTTPDAPITQVLHETVTDAGLDRDTFVRCMDHPQTAQQIESYTAMMHTYSDTTPPTVAVVSVFTGVINPTTVAQSSTP